MLDIDALSVQVDKLMFINENPPIYKVGDKGDWIVSGDKYFGTPDTPTAGTIVYEKVEDAGFGVYRMYGIFDGAKIIGVNEHSIQEYIQDKL